jgi:hypothetical protein
MVSEVVRQAEMGTYSAIRWLAELWLLTPEKQHKGLLVIFQPYNVFMDESGTHDGSPVVAVAGLISTFERWIDLEREWARILMAYHVPVFHMSDFEAGRGVFRGWPPDRRRQFLGRLITTIVDNTIAGFGCAMMMEQYERCVPEDVRLALKHPYYFCLHNCLRTLLVFHDEITGSFQHRFRFLFDRKPTYEGIAAQTYYNVRERLDSPGILGDMTFGNKQEYIPLQAADLLVYEVAKHCLNWYTVPRRPKRVSLQLSEVNRELSIAVPTDDQLRMFADDFRVEWLPRNTS